MDNKRWKFTKENLISTAKVIAYTGGSAMIATAIVAWGDVELPTQYIWLSGLVNVILVAVQQLLNKNK